MKHLVFSGEVKFPVSVGSLDLMRPSVDEKKQFL